MNILGIDIETTGLSGNKLKKNNSDLLEIGLVFYDSEKFKGLSYTELDEAIPKARLIVHRPTKYLQGGLVAFDMHKDTLIPLHKSLDDPKARTDVLLRLQEETNSSLSTYVVEPEEVVDRLWACLYELGWENNYMHRGGQDKLKNTLTVAGKNVGIFDIPYMRDYLDDFNKKIKVRTRVFDPTVFFADFDEDKLPDLEECKSTAKLVDSDFPNGEVKHTAVEDAMDVINLIHFARNNKLYALQNK